MTGPVFAAITVLTAATALGLWFFSNHFDPPVESTYFGYGWLAAIYSQELGDYLRARRKRNRK